MKKEQGRQLALWGAWLQLGPILGILGTVVGMVRAFGKISANDPASAEALASDISIALITTAIGMIPALVGLVLMGVALFVKKYRGSWFFWFLLVYGALCALEFPVGTVFGGALMIYLVWTKDEFLTDKRDHGGAGSIASRRA